MRIQLTRFLFTAILGGTLLASAGHSYADRDQDRERRERRDDRREERYERRVEHRDRFRPYQAPPAVRYERHVHRPGYVWINGGYDWRDGQYVWVGGRYERERRGYRWREPRWEVRDGVYVRIDGDWIVSGPVAAPPVIREERWAPRRGFVYVRGHWEWNGADWAWAPGHYERERVGYVYREPRWEMRDGVYVKIDGAWVVR